MTPKQATALRLLVRYEEKLRAEGRDPTIYPAAVSSEGTFTDADQPFVNWRTVEALVDRGLARVEWSEEGSSVWLTERGREEASV